MTNIEFMNYWVESSDEDYKTMKILYENNIVGVYLQDIQQQKNY